MIIECRRSYESGVRPHPSPTAVHDALRGSRALAKLGKATAKNMMDGVGRNGLEFDNKKGSP